MFFRALCFSLLTLSPLAAQGPPVGIIDFFGVRKADIVRLKKALGVAEGDPLPKSKGLVEDRMELVNLVVRARLEAVCCEDGKAILYVGVEEKGAPAFNYRDTPEGMMKLPVEVVEAYQQFFEKLQVAIRANDIAEDVTQGHSLMANADARELQLKLIPLAKANEAILRDVLRNSVDEVERATAAYVIAYAPDKSKIIDDLQYAMQDPDDGVRNNAMRSLLGITILSEKKPELGLKISPVWFIEQLNSIVWSDRNKAATALLALTDKRDEKILTLIRERAIDALVDMARWRNLGHALPGYILLGRIDGVPEAKLQAAWSEGKHQPLTEEIIKDLTQRPRRK